MGASARQVTKYFLGTYEGREKAENLFAKIKNDNLKAFMLNLFLVIEDMMEVRRAVTNEFKFWFRKREKCCIYVRPASDKFDIYLASFTEDQINEKAKSQGLELAVSYDTNNENDQFHAKITIAEQWLIAHREDQVAILLFIKQLLRDLPDQTK